jgi:hypothetical protein
MGKQVNKAFARTGDRIISEFTLVLVYLVAVRNS